MPIYMWENTNNRISNRLTIAVLPGFIGLIKEKGYKRYEIFKGFEETGAGLFAV